MKKTTSKKAETKPAKKASPPAKPAPLPPMPSHPKPYYVAADGTKVEMKGRVTKGDTIAGRFVSDFEPDGRIIFRKEERPATKPSSFVSTPASTPFDVDGPTLVKALSVNSPTDSDEAEEVWDEGTSLDKLKAATTWLDLNYRNRNAYIGVELYGPAPRILAALAALTQRKPK